MNLIIDVGNSRIKLGIYHNDAFVEKHVWESWNLNDLKTLATNQNIQNAILCNVRPDVPIEIAQFLQQHFFLLN